MRRLGMLAGLVALVLLSPPAGIRADDWPEWRGPTRDGVWRETGLVEKFASDQLPVVWRAPISSGYCGPTVAHGRVYVTDRITKPTQQERIHCFDAADGKPLWTLAYDCTYGKIGYQETGPRAMRHCG